MDLTRGNNGPGIVKPEIRNNVDFEIKSQFIKESRLNLFMGIQDKDAHEHVRRVLEIADLFYIPGVTHDVIMLRVFPITLIREARRWKNMLPARSINTQDLLEKAFIWKYCPPLKTAKKLKEIRNFKQEMDDVEDEAQAFRTLEGLKKKPINEEDAVKLNDSSTILQNQLPLKENDPESFTLHCLIGSLNIRNALADLGASINVMPFSMFKRLNIGNLQPTNMIIEMAYMTKKAPRGLLVQSDKFIFTVYFVITDMAEDPKAPFILERPLLAIAHARIDVFNKRISLGLGNERIMFKMNELVELNNIEEVAVNGTEIMIEMDTDRLAQGAT
ncbi:zinc knuckle CX2CX4HX4C containing protein [Tanacetum coccineum]